MYLRSFNATFLQCKGENLLSKHMIGQRWRLHWLHEPLPPEEHDRCRPQERVLSRGEEKAVSLTPRTTTGPAETLEERGHRVRRIDLDHPVEVANIDTKFECGRCAPESEPVEGLIQAKAGREDSLHV